MSTSNPGTPNDKGTGGGRKGKRFGSASKLGRVLQMSPEGKNPTKNKRTKSVSEISIIHIKPNEGADSCCGFLVVINGYGEYVLSNILYRRNEIPHLEFIEDLVPIGRVVTVQNHGEIVLNANGHRQKAMPFPAEYSTTQEMLLEWCNNSLIPAMDALGHLNEPPVMAAEWYSRVDAWSHTMSEEDLTFCVRTLKGPFANYIKHGHHCLYSVWTTGTVPVQSCIRRYQLERDHLRHPDFVNKIQDLVRRNQPLPIGIDANGDEIPQPPTDDEEDNEEEEAVEQDAQNA